MRRIAVMLATVALLVIAGATPAFGHVTVNPKEAAAGSFTTLTFQVPNESESANTTKLEVRFPQEPAISSARTKPVPGWTAEVNKEGDAVTSVVFTADDGGFGPTEFQQFQISLRLPESGEEIVFPAIQTYSDGEEARWVETQAEGAPEPEHPAPVVTLTEAEGGGGHGAAPTTTSPNTDTTSGNGDGTNTAATPTSAVTEDDVDTAQTLAIVALVIAILGVLAGIGGVLMARRRTS